MFVIDLFFSSVRLEHTIGKQPPLTNEDRSKFTVLARMQRVECAIIDIKQTIENINVSLRHIDDRLSHIPLSNFPQRSARYTGVKFSSVDQEIP